MRLADVAIVQQRGVAVDLVTIPRGKGLAHDPDCGPVPGALRSADSALDRPRRHRSNLVQRVGVPEVRVERRDDDVGDGRHQADPGERYPAPPFDDDAPVEDPLEDLRNVVPHGALNRHPTLGVYAGTASVQSTSTATLRWRSSTESTRSPLFGLVRTRMPSTSAIGPRRIRTRWPSFR